ncbi:DNA repair protein XRCC1 [Protobothrops mucrosquamatus]|uniref:DNA repair protein XRCC1 n=1 Tax=Protobothrops mucrosquamatus TaxID=103944 RepID=UPI000775868E|nr:DNA repair protein XRCC1 [Protobothrops mucrosquamatus]
MPEIEIRHVVSASSSDTTHCAENLLKADTYRKWKAAQAGEKQISVILQFEKEEQIHSIDIGNEGSAFVEVLAGSSASASEQNYEVLLVTSSFMSPSESKSSTNLNRVRMFGSDKLVKATAEKKWDRVKIVCTQPYTKSLAYGLSFVRFHSPPDSTETHSKMASPKVTKLGQFKVKEDDSNSSSLKPGALFFSRASKPLVSPPKASQNDQPSPSYAAASLQTNKSLSPDSSPSAVEKPTIKTPPKEPTPVKRKFEFSKENAALSSATKKANPEKSRVTHPPAKKHKVSLSTSPPQKTLPFKKALPTQSLEETANGSFQQLLQGTVFVLSGFQNPFRSELRDKALEMGAKYRPDWTPDSTHLICAFANTPKYSQVKGLGGTIVRKEWILDCYRSRRCLPCKQYLMGSPDSSSSEQEEESEEETTAAHRRVLTPQQKTSVPSPNHKIKPATSPKVTQAVPPRVSSEEEEEEEPTTSQNSNIHNNSRASSGDEKFAGLQDNGDEGSGDTDDELRRVEEEHRKKQQGGRRLVPEPDSDPYAGSTDENTDVEEQPEPDQPIPELPDLFVGKCFFLYGEFPSQERRLLNRYIIAFNGELEDYMNERVNYVITAQEWDDTFDEALNENPNLSFVRPRWIYNCNDRQKLIPHQPYVVVPRA